MSLACAPLLADGTLLNVPRDDYTAHQFDASKFSAAISAHIGELHDAAVNNYRPQAEYAALLTRHSIHTRLAADGMLLLRPSLRDGYRAPPCRAAGRECDARALFAPSQRGET